MKKAFTLSEALVTLAIIGVLAAILIPVVNNVKPDKDKVAYKKALYSMQSAVSNVLDKFEYEFSGDGYDGDLNLGGIMTSQNNYYSNAAWYWSDSNTTKSAGQARGDYDFCTMLHHALNTVTDVKKCYDGVSSYDEPDIITSDGIRYWGLEGNFTSINPGTNGKFNGSYKEIYVDRKLSDAELGRIDKIRGDGVTTPGLKIKVYGDGKVEVPESTNDYEQELVIQGLDMAKGTAKN